MSDAGSLSPLANQAREGLPALRRVAPALEDCADRRAEYDSALERASIKCAARRRRSTMGGGREVPSTLLAEIESHFG